MSRKDGFNRGEAYKVLARFLKGAAIVTPRVTFGTGSIETNPSQTVFTQVDAAIRYYSAYNSLEDAMNAMLYKMAQVEDKFLKSQKLNSSYTYNYGGSISGAHNTIIDRSAGYITLGKRKQISLNGSKFFVLEQDYGIAKNSESTATGGYYFSSVALKNTVDSIAQSQASEFYGHYILVAKEISKVCFGHPDITIASPDNNSLDTGTLWGTGFTGEDRKTNSMNNVRRRLGVLLKDNKKKWSDLPDLPEGKVIRAITEKNFIHLIDSYNEGIYKYTEKFSADDIVKLLKRYSIKTIGTGKDTLSVESITAKNLASKANDIKSALKAKKAFSSSNESLPSNLLEATCDIDLVTPNIKGPIEGKNAYTDESSDCYGYSYQEPPEGWKYFTVKGSQEENDAPIRVYYPARFFKEYDDLPSYIKDVLNSYYGNNIATGNTGYVSIKGNDVLLSSTSKTGYTALADRKIIDNQKLAIKDINACLKLYYYINLPEVDRIFDLLGVSHIYNKIWREGAHQVFPHFSLLFRAHNKNSVLYHNNSSIPYQKDLVSEDSYGYSSNGARRRLMLTYGGSSSILSYYNNTSKNTKFPEYKEENGYAYSTLKALWLITHESLHQSRNGTKPGLSGWLNEGMSDTIWGSLDGGRPLWFIMNINTLMSWIYSTFSPSNEWMNAIAYDSVGDKLIYNAIETVKTDSNGKATLTKYVASNNKELYATSKSTAESISAYLSVEIKYINDKTIYTNQYNKSIKVKYVYYNKEAKSAIETVKTDATGKATLKNTVTTTGTKSTAATIKINAESISAVLDDTKATTAVNIVYVSGQTIYTDQSSKSIKVTYKYYNTAKKVTESITDTVTTDSTGKATLTQIVAKQKNKSTAATTTTTNAYFIYAILTSPTVSIKAVNKSTITTDKKSTNITVSYKYSPLPSRYGRYAGGSTIIRWLIWSVMQGWDQEWAKNERKKFDTIDTPYYNPS